MTANQMADMLEEKLDRADSFGSPGYEDFDLTSVLTEAQHLYVKKFFDEVNNRKQKGFEETEIRNQGLSALVKDGDNLSVSTDQVGVITNNNVTGKFYDLPNDHMYTIYEQCTIDKKECDTDAFIIGWVMVVAHNEMQRYNWSKYKKPFYRVTGDCRVWRSEFSRKDSGRADNNPVKTDKRHELFTDGTFNVTNYHIRYVKNPLEIVVNRTTTTDQKNCELDTSTHVVIVGIATDLMMQRVKEQKVQTIENFRDLE
tara:strand:- start:638 stop:1405 length:768 start_codon:yes stop_codon:yes gene_type:complete